MQETDRRMQETDRQMQETDQQLSRLSKETWLQLKELGKQIGGLGNMFGNVTEGLMVGSLEDIMLNHFHLDHVLKNVYAAKQKMEFDMVAYANTRINEVIITEIKTQLSLSAIEQVQKQLSVFLTVFPEHKNKKIYGAIAAIADKKELRQSVWDAGLYYFCMSQDVVKMHIPKNFKPKDFGSITG